MGRPARLLLLLLPLLLLLVAAPVARARNKPLGIHFDIEPQTLAAWRANTDAVFIQLLALLVKLQTRWHANGKPGTYVWDIPNWYQTYSITVNGTSRSYMEWTLRNVDWPNIMNFQNAYGNLIMRGKPTLDFAKSLNLPVSVALETVNVGEPSLSFFNTSLQNFQSTLVQVDRVWAQTYGDNYKGLVLHDYTGIVALPDNNQALLPDRLPVNVYVWQWWFAFDNYTTVRQQMWADLKKLPFNVTTISFEAEYLIQADQQSLQRVVDEGVSHGIQTEFAFGYANWTFTDQHWYPELLMQFTANFIKYGPLKNPYVLPTSPPSGGGGSGTGGGGDGGGFPDIPTAPPTPGYVPEFYPWPTRGPYRTNMDDGGSASDSRPDDFTYVSAAPSVTASDVAVPVVLALLLLLVLMGLQLQ